jgi:hypothetical protein
MLENERQSTTLPTPPLKTHRPSRTRAKNESKQAGCKDLPGTGRVLVRLLGNATTKEASMTWRTILPALAALALGSGAAWAQSKDVDPNQVPDKIREKLSAEGYQDVKVAPGSYVVSAKDKDGNRVVMLIGPTSMTMMKVPDNPSTAQTPDNKDEIIQQ